MLIVVVVVAVESICRSGCQSDNFLLDQPRRVPDGQGKPDKSRRCSVEARSGIVWDGDGERGGFTR